MAIFVGVICAKMTQTEQVVQAMKSNGGFATLRRLNEIVDFSTWATRTPEATVRRIVQDCDAIFRIEPGLWALEECRAEVLKRFSVKQGDAKSKEQFSHGYYQGLLVEIGKMKFCSTYVPPQDKNRLFLDKRLGDVADYTTMLPFTYPEILRRATTVDVVWFNERRMPCDMFEVEHTTDMRNSLSKFYELQDFHVRFAIVADSARRKEFDSVVAQSIYSAIKGRVAFISYDSVAGKYNGLQTEKAAGW